MKCSALTKMENMIIKIIFNNNYEFTTGSFLFFCCFVRIWSSPLRLPNMAGGPCVCWFHENGQYGMGIVAHDMYEMYINMCFQ